MAGLAKTIGNGAATNSFTEIGPHSNCILMIGSNPENGHPIAAMHIQRALNRGAKLIVIDPIKTEFASRADVHLQLAPEHNIAVINALIHVLFEEDLINWEFVNAHTKGVEYVREVVKDYSPETVSKYANLNPEDIRKAARMYATIRPAVITHGMGVTHFNHGVGAVCDISNLFLLTGNVGELGSGDLPIRGQENVQGCCDMGVLPNIFSNLGSVTDPEQRAWFEKVWHLEPGFLSGKIGLHKTEVPDAILDGRIHFFWTMGENPVMTDPNTNHFLKAISKIDMYVCQDIFLTETSLKADVVLPGVASSEKEGLYANAERRVQHNEAVITPPGDARQDWWIICEIARRLGAKEGFNFKSPEEIWEEERKCDPRRYGGMSYYRIKKHHGLHWPCPNEDDMGGQSLYLDKKFFTPDGKGKLIPCLHVGSLAEIEPAKEEFRKRINLPDDWEVMAGSVDEPTDENYPIQLLTTRKVYQYAGGIMTRRSKAIENGGDSIGPIAEMHPNLTKRYGIKHGEFIKAWSRYGYIVIKADITDVVPDGIIQMTYHYWESCCNELTSNGWDLIAKTPTFKAAIQIKRIEEDEFLRIRAEKRIKFQTDKVIFDDYHHHPCTGDAPVVH
ncbi:Formate dehydrogenase H [Campylobacter suis]|uniref:Formate dehydrogenase H n=1 Tax=Campylobacter suis TaxID=2790657 RepID=A0ABM8Q2A5_9BACT|nr:Formate dehydrogenase H [Campylobacter suis]